MRLARTRFKASTEVPCVSARTGKSSAASLTSSSPDTAERIMPKSELSALDIIRPLLTSKRPISEVMWCDLFKDSVMPSYLWKILSTFGDRSFPLKSCPTSFDQDYYTVCSESLFTVEVAGSSSYLSRNTQLSYSHHYPLATRCLRFFSHFFNRRYPSTTNNARDDQIRKELQNPHRNLPSV